MYDPLSALTSCVCLSPVLYSSLRLFLQDSNADAGSAAEHPDQVDDEHFACKRQEQLDKPMQAMHPANEWTCSDGALASSIQDRCLISYDLSIDDYDMCLCLCEALFQKQSRVKC